MSSTDELVGCKHGIAGYCTACTEQSTVTALRTRIAELEQLCDQTYVAQGADAYNDACSEMERWQSERVQAGKEAGCEGSLCDGMAWLYGRIAELERRLEIDSRAEGYDGIACRDVTIRVLEAENRVMCERVERLEALCHNAADSIQTWCICYPGEELEEDIDLVAALRSARKEQT